MKRLRQTTHEKNMLRCGTEIVTWQHEIIMDTLLDYFHADYSKLLLRAAMDNTNRRTICFSLDFENNAKHNTNVRGSVFYNKKLRKFTHIQYA